MTDQTRITVETVVRTPQASKLYRRDITEFLAACHRHDIPEDGEVALAINTQGGTDYFALVATKTIEWGAL